VCRLCEADADSLFQRLESQVREVVIEMKVRLLKELTVDQKVEPRAHQFVSLLLAEYAQLCASSQQAGFLAPFVRYDVELTLLDAVTVAAQVILPVPIRTVVRQIPGSGLNHLVDFGAIWQVHS